VWPETGSRKRIVRVQLLTTHLQILDLQTIHSFLEAMDADLETILYTRVANRVEWEGKNKAKSKARAKTTARMRATMLRWKLVLSQRRPPWHHMASCPQQQRQPQNRCSNNGSSYKHGALENHTEVGALTDVKLL
jgi:hypothetical protein